MKLTAVKFRCMVPPPQHTLKSTSALNDVFEAPDYAIETRREWLRVTHVQTGKSRLYPQSWCMGADELPQEPNGQQQRQQGGQRR